MSHLVLDHNYAAIAALSWGNPWAYIRFARIIEDTHVSAAVDDILMQIEAHDHYRRATD